MTNCPKQPNKGQLLLEIILSLALLLSIGGFVSYLVIDASKSANIASKSNRALSFAQEGIEAIRSIRDRSWEPIVAQLNDDTSGVTSAFGLWEFTSDPNVEDVYTRTISFFEVYRFDDGKGALADDPSGEGVALDPFTIKVNSTVKWEAMPGTEMSVSLDTFVTNWESVNWIETTISDFNDGAFSGTQSIGIGDGAIQLSQLSEGFTMEIGSTVATESWNTVQTIHSYENPVVVAGYNNHTNFVPATVRLRNVAKGSFSIKLENPSGAGLNPTNVPYLVIEEGTWSIGDLFVEARNHSTSAVGSKETGWNAEPILFAQVYNEPPLVLHTVASDNDVDWVSSWVSAIDDPTSPPTVDGFQIGLNCAEACSTHGAETISWIALTNNHQGSVATSRFETMLVPDDENGPRGVDDGCFEFGYGEAFPVNPLVFSSLQTMNDSDGGWAASCALNMSAASINIEEDQVIDLERHHLNEAVGIVSFEKEAEMVPEISAVWDFDIPGDYTYEPAQIEVSGSNATKISCDDPNMSEIYPLVVAEFADVAEWRSFTEVATKDNAEIYYQLASDIHVWKYWNGVDWWSVEECPSDPCYNTAEEVNAHIRDWHTGPNRVAFRALMQCNPGGSVSLDKVIIKLQLVKTGGQYTVYGEYESSPFNTGLSNTKWVHLEWTENIPTANEDMKVYIATAPDAGGAPGAWTGWTGPYTEPQSNWLFGLPANNSWIKYRIEMSSNDDGSDTPTLYDITVNYRP